MAVFLPGLFSDNYACTRHDAHESPLLPPESLQPATGFFSTYPGPLVPLRPFPYLALGRGVFLQVPIQAAQKESVNLLTECRNTIFPSIVLPSLSR
jgi:hypothetical protein